MENPNAYQNSVSKYCSGLRSFKTPAATHGRTRGRIHARRSLDARKHPHTRTYEHTRTHTQTHTHTHTRDRTHARARVPTHIYRMHIYINIQIYTCRTTFAQLYKNPHALSRSLQLQNAIQLQGVGTSHHVAPKVRQRHCWPQGVELCASLPLGP